MNGPLEQQGKTFSTVKTLYGIASALGVDLSLELLNPQETAAQPVSLGSKAQGSRINVLVAAIVTGV